MLRVSLQHSRSAPCSRWRPLAAIPLIPVAADPLNKPPAGGPLREASRPHRSPSTANLCGGAPVRPEDFSRHPPDPRPFGMSRVAAFAFGGCGHASEIGFKQRTALLHRRPRLESPRVKNDSTTGLLLVHSDGKRSPDWFRSSGRQYGAGERSSNVADLGLRSGVQMMLPDEFTAIAHVHTPEDPTHMFLGRVD